MGRACAACLMAELARGRVELGEARTGREQPIVVAVAAGSDGLRAVLPLDPRLRADPAAVPDRGFELAAGAVGALVEACEPEPPRSNADLGLLAGEDGGFLVLVYPADDETWRVEFAREALDEACRHIDRLRARSSALPGHVLEPADLRAPTGATHPLRVAETISRLGGRRSTTNRRACSRTGCSPCSSHPAPSRGPTTTRTRAGG